MSENYVKPQAIWYVAIFRTTLQKNEALLNEIYQSNTMVQNESLGIMGAFDFDSSSKMIHLVPFPKDPTAPKAAQLFLNNIYRYNGLPFVISCSQNSVSVSKFCTSLLRQLNKKISPSSAGNFWDRRTNKDHKPKVEW